MGAYVSEKIWINASTSHGFLPCWMAAAMNAIITPVAAASQRNTLAGGTCRSAMAPNMSGEMKAARAVAAKAYDLMRCRPWASRIVPSGTNQMPIAAAWMKNKIISSAYSALRKVLNIGVQHSHSGRKSKSAAGEAAP